MPDLPDSIPLGVLKQTHPAYTPDIWTELTDLYAGGYQLQANAARYMPKLAGENDRRYQDRLKAAGYIGYLGQIVDYFVSALFAQELTIREASDAANPKTPGGKSDTAFYTAFAHDADLSGSSFQQIVHDAFRDAILLKKSLLCVDFPAKAEASQIRSKADEDAIGTSRAYVYQMPLDQLINWKCDKFGSFVFAVIYTTDSDQESPAVFRGSAIRHRFKVWTRDAGGPAKFWVYEKVEQPSVEKFTPDTIIPLVDSGSTTFDQVPIVRFEIKSGLWVGNKLGLLSKEHYCRRSTLVSSENKSMVSIPYISRGPEIGAIGGAVPSATQQMPNRGADPISTFAAMGWIEIGKDDKIGFAEPGGACYAQVGKELGELKDEMHRIVHQMAASVDNSSGMQRRSGQSKREDRSAEAIVLGQYGKDVRELAKKVYDTIANGRGEKVVWNVGGLDRFNTGDRATLLTEAVQADMVPIPSPTFKKAHRKQLAFALIENLAPETQDLIAKEIDDGVDAEDELRGMILDAKKDAIENPPPPAAVATPGANGAPPAKGPPGKQPPAASA